jgi:hypothetical protein
MTWGWCQPRRRWTRGGLARLTLDDDQRDALACHLDSVSMAELVWRESPPHAGSRGGVAQLGARGAG